jgi:hypothetical protein
MTACDAVADGNFSVIMRESIGHHDRVICADSGVVVVTPEPAAGRVHPSDGPEDINVPSRDQILPASVRWTTISGAFLRTRDASFFKAWVKNMTDASKKTMRTYAKRSALFFPFLRAREERVKSMMFRCLSIT